MNGEEVVISNTNLLNKELHNLSRTPRRRVEFTLHLVYFTPSTALAKIPEIAQALIDRHDNCRLVRCGVWNLGAPAIDFQVQFDVLTSSADEAFAARNAVARASFAALEKEGIEFAGPDGKSISLPAMQPPPGAAGGPPLEERG